MKRFSFGIIITILCICLCSCTNIKTLPPYVQTGFYANKDVFDSLNKYFINHYETIASTEDELSFVFEFSDETGKVEELYCSYLDDYIYLEEEISMLFSKVREAFIYDFSYITITNNVIDYSGDGYEKYIYSLDGKKPKSFWQDGTKTSFSKYSLGENWYYLELNVR